MIKSGDAVRGLELPSGGSEFEGEGGGGVCQVSSACALP